MHLFKYILISFLFLSLGINAQPGIGSAKALIRLEFEDIYGLKISQDEINLNIDSIEKFNQGTQTNWLNSHLSVTGLKSFEISVKSIQPYFYSNNSETNVSVSNVRINAKSNTRSNVVNLSNSTQTLITETNGGIITYFDVKYEIPAEKTSAFFNQTSKIFETLIVYTLIPN